MPAARSLGIDRQHALRASLRADERCGQESPVAGGEGRIFGRRTPVLDIADRNRRTGLNRIGRGPACCRRPRLE